MILPGLNLPPFENSSGDRRAGKYLGKDHRIIAVLLKPEFYTIY